MEVIIVFSTVPTKDAARQIGTLLVEKQLVACVNILPGVESVYKWEGKVQSEKECVMMMKTTNACYERLERVLTDLHPYDVPAIVSAPVTDGSSEYLSWVCGQVAP